MAKEQMETVVIIYEGKEVTIPMADLEWFVTEKGAKEKKKNK
jgi:hypothetical protein